MKIPISKRTNAGHALVEAVMALAVLGIAAAGVMGSFNTGFFLMGMVRENQRATQILLEKVETIRLYSWDQLNKPNFLPTGTWTNYYDPQAPVGKQGVAYSGTIEKGPFPFTPAPSYAANLMQLTITLTWKGQGGITRTRSLTTLVAKDGVQNYVY